VDKKVFFAPSRLRVRKNLPNLSIGGVDCRAAARQAAKICVNLRNLWIKKSSSRLRAFA